MGVIDSEWLEHEERKIRRSSRGVVVVGVVLTLALVPAVAHAARYALAVGGWEHHQARIVETDTVGAKHGHYALVRTEQVIRRSDGVLDGQRAVASEALGERMFASADDDGRTFVVPANLRDAGGSVTLLVHPDDPARMRLLGPGTRGDVLALVGLVVGGVGAWLLVMTFLGRRRRESLTGRSHRSDG